MYSVIQSPCIFEPSPMLNVFGGKSLGNGPEPKRRRGMALTACCRPARDFPRISPVALRYSVEETEDSFFLSIFKKVPKGKLIDAVSEEIEKLKEKSYRPVYHIVHDMFGNPFYLEEEQNEDELLKKALSQLDLKALNRKVARDLFQDHSVELNHRGDELTITSQNDGICKSFEIGEQIGDVRIVGCQLDDSNDYAILKLVLEKVPKANDLVKLIKWSEIPTAKLRQPRDIAMADTKEQMRGKELKKTGDERRKVEARQEAPRKEKTARNLGQNEIAEQERLLEKKYLDHHDHRIEKEKKESKLRKKAAKEKKYKEKKAVLVAKKKTERLEKKSAQDSNHQTAGPKTINININFGDQQNDMLTDNQRNEYDAPLKRLPSPILEDVEDEELDRFHESLIRSPKGSSIIEDV